MDALFQAFIDLSMEFGLARGMFVAFFFIAHFVLFKQYGARISDRQKEIDRLAQDNRDYRDRFLKLFDNKFNVKK